MFQKKNLITFIKKIYLIKSFCKPWDFLVWTINSHQDGISFIRASICIKKGLAHDLEHKGKGP